MTLPIRTLDREEKWDCHNCGNCCRGSIIPLDADDLDRLAAQKWDQHPDYRGVQTVVRTSLPGHRYQLAQRPDGSCVFLAEDGLCRIHAEHGAEAKPLVCRVFPLQLVPLEKFAYLTTRRSCPSAAADRGRPLTEHLAEIKRWVKQGRLAAERGAPPPLTRKQRRPWSDVLLFCERLERLLCDERLPLVRRLVQGLHFCDLLAQCRLAKFEAGGLGELLDVLEESAQREAGEPFRDRQPPRKAAAVLFRQTAAEYLRLHPGLAVQAGWRERIALARAALAFARGRGSVPRIHPAFPETTFAALEEPLGHLNEDVLRPLTSYFETMAASKQYVVAGRAGWSVVERFRSLTLAYAVALWMLRFRCKNREPEPADMIDIIAAVERGQGYATLDGRRHRQRVATLARLEQLDRLVVWYAR